MNNISNEDYIASLKIEKKAPYLYQINYTDWDYSLGSGYFEKYHNTLGACSAVRNQNYYGRNYDWYYDDSATFIVYCKKTKTRHASIGVAGGNPRITDALVDSGSYSSEYRYLPFLTLDGINDHGVVANINVTAVGDRGHTTGTNLNGQDMCAIMLVRYILDYADSAAHAIKLIKELNIYCPISESYTDEMHWMIADKDETYIVELIDNEVKIISQFVGNKPIMTNFYLYGFNGNTATAYYKPTEYDPLTTTLTAHSMGIERYDILSDGYNDADTKRGMINLLENVRYTKAYDDQTSPFWYSEFSADLSNTSYGDLTINSTVEDYAAIVAYTKNLYENRQRDSRATWQTVHSSVYDIDDMKLWVKVQETSEEYAFRLEKESDISDSNYTSAQEIYDSFESTFQDKQIIPDELEFMWLQKAIGKFSIELYEINFDDSTGQFHDKLPRCVIDLLGLYMKLFYQERQVSKVNKRASIVTKDLSWDGSNGTKTSERAHLEYVYSQILQLENDIKTISYA